MNKVFMIGNLTKDPELRATQEGVPVCNFSIAVNRKYKDAQGKQGVDYFDVVVWRGRAENCARYLAKGKKVAVTGECQTGSYQGQDGIHRKTWTVHADEVAFLSPPGQGEASRVPEAQREIQRGFEPPYDDTPAGFTEIDDDELPF